MTLSSICFFAALAAMVGVFLTLCSGLVVLPQGGQKKRRTSQSLMRLRVALQAVAVLFLLLAWVIR
ncbi:MAG: twin transmembrane helix small protein [Alphaproteobacteria bacterium]|nr:twin transmembrane helix small protein [Alphaproteobacteria bacterium]